MNINRRMLLIADLKAQLLVGMAVAKHEKAFAPLTQQQPQQPMENPNVSTNSQNIAPPPEVPDSGGQPSTP